MSAINDVEFDTVFSLTANGDVIEHLDMHAPTVMCGESSGDPDIYIEDSSGQWAPLTGYTGQYSYNGAVMHASGYIGGRLEEDILDTELHPIGTRFVVCVVNVQDDSDDGDDIEPAGWCVLASFAHIPKEEI